jgi:adhesin transport system membrane fusion protein
MAHDNAAAAAPLLAAEAWPDAHPDTAPGRPHSSAMLYVLTAAVTAFLLWASLFEIDQAVRTQGQFMPSAHTQVVQAVDGGVLARLRVREGDTVQAGQVLAELSPERARAAFDESNAKLLSLQAALQRASAEAAEQTPAFGRELAAYPEIVDAQRKLHTQRRHSLDEALAGIAQAMDLAREELRMNESLLATGDASRVEVMRAQRQVAELQARASELRNRYLQEARTEAARLSEDLATLRSRQAERSDVLAHTAITAPMAGVVKNMRLVTVGGVLRPGDELLQISPTEGELLLELRINPSDIGQLKLGQRATLRLDAFDYAINGTLEGELVYLGADTLTEPGPGGQPLSFYRAHVRVDEAVRARNPKLAAIAIKPGMTATVDVRSGQRSVLAYLLKPISRAVGGALTER